MGVEAVDLAGRRYDPGLAPDVIEVRRDDHLPQGSAMIDETITPTVTLHGRVVNPGQIAVRQSTEQPPGRMGEQQ
jgi:hypothetical protein